MCRWEGLAVPRKMKSEYYISYCTTNGLMPPTTTVCDTDSLGEGDSRLVLNLLPEDENWMEKLKEEVQFKVMLHRGVADFFMLYSVFRSAHFCWDLQGERSLDLSQYRAR